MWVVYDVVEREELGRFETKEQAETKLKKWIAENPDDDYSDCEVLKLKKYYVDQWIHAHYMTEVYAVDFEDAKKAAENDTTEIKFKDLDIGDGGISCIYDEDGNEYWCE